MKNHVDLIGRAGKDPEIKTVGEHGTKIAEFSLATNTNWKDANGERQEKTQWHSLIAWRGIADICEKYVKKGSLISTKKVVWKVTICNQIIFSTIRR